MLITDHDADEALRAHASYVSAGQPYNARIMEVFASQRGQTVKMAYWDRCKDLYRSWLVFGPFAASQAQS